MTETESPAIPAAAQLSIVARGEREIEMSRVLAAPRHLVFAAWTRPELVRRWLLGPPGWTMPVCEIDLRVGGRYRYVWQGPDGKEMAMGGVYREVEPPARLVATELFDEDWTGGETLSTLELREHEGRTTVVQTVRYASREARDGALRCGMDSGLEASYRRLEEVLAELS